jgi:hypothetical protein
VSRRSNDRPGGLFRFRYDARASFQRPVDRATVGDGERAFLDTMRRCKLYDFDNHRWLDFDGKPTTGTARMFSMTAKELLAPRQAVRALQIVQLRKAA